MTDLIIEEESYYALPITPCFGEQELSKATAFAVVHADAHYLVTNWHVVTGRRSDTGECMSRTGAIPDRLVVWHHFAARRGHWAGVETPLYDAEGEPLWLEHQRGREVDVVAIPLAETDALDFYTYDLDEPGADMVIYASAEVSILGFPFGLTSGGAFPIWSRGTIASEPHLDWEGLPRMLVDSRTREGQSGSPVIRYAREIYTTTGGGTITSNAPASRFLGIYSGRVNDKSDLSGVFFGASEC